MSGRRADRRNLPVAGVLALLAAAALALPARAGAAPCLDCHEKREIGAGSAACIAFAEDDCTACHGDHGDNARLVLTESGNALCEGCHDNGAGDFVRAHRGVTGSKVACISVTTRTARPRSTSSSPPPRPLASGAATLPRYDGTLLKPVGELCLGCHDKEAFSRRIAHAPVKRGTCLACHEPHASREPLLLRARYAPGAGSPARATSHLSHLPRPAEFLLGRGGAHPLPVGRPQLPRPAPARSDGVRPGGSRQALSCRNCHDAHSTDGARLVRRELDCGGTPASSWTSSARTRRPVPLGMSRPAGLPLCGEARPVTAYVQPPAALAARGRLRSPSKARSKPASTPVRRCHEKAVKRFAKGGSRPGAGGSLRLLPPRPRPREPPDPARPRGPRLRPLPRPQDAGGGRRARRLFDRGEPLLGVPRPAQRGATRLRLRAAATPRSRRATAAPARKAEAGWKIAANPTGSAANATTRSAARRTPTARSPPRAASAVITRTSRGRRPCCGSRARALLHLPPARALRPGDDPRPGARGGVRRLSPAHGSANHHLLARPSRSSSTGRLPAGDFGLCWSATTRGRSPIRTARPTRASRTGAQSARAAPARPGFDVGDRHPRAARDHLPQLPRAARDGEPEADPAGAGLRRGALSPDRIPQGGRRGQVPRRLPRQPVLPAGALTPPRVPAPAQVA